FSSRALIASTRGCNRRRKRAFAEPNRAVMPRSNRPRTLLPRPETTSQVRSRTSIFDSKNTCMVWATRAGAALVEATGLRRLPNVRPFEESLQAHGADRTGLECGYRLPDKDHVLYLSVWSPVQSKSDGPHHAKVGCGRKMSATFSQQKVYCDLKKGSRRLPGWPGRLGRCGRPLRRWKCLGF